MTLKKSKKSLIILFTHHTMRTTQYEERRLNSRIIYNIIPLIKKNGLFFLENEPFTGIVWRVDTFYKDVEVSHYFINETDANFFADGYLANTGQNAKVLKKTFNNGKKHKI